MKLVSYSSTIFQYLFQRQDNSEIRERMHYLSIKQTCFHVNFIAIQYIKLVQIWPVRFVCKSGDISPGHIWTTLYIPHSYRAASWYYQSFIYSPTDALVSCLKNNIKIYIKIYIRTLYCQTVWQTAIKT